MASIIIDLDTNDPEVLETYVAAVSAQAEMTPIQSVVRSSLSPAVFKEDAEDALTSWWEDDIPTHRDIVAGTDTTHAYARGMLDVLMSTFPYPDEAGDWTITRADVWVSLFPDQLVPKTFDEIAAAQGWNADSQNTILRDYIAGPKMVTLDEYARHRADVENGKA